jgi:hypothetical protein
MANEVVESTIKRLARERDEALGLWNTERELYGVASDETEEALHQALKDLSSEQRRLWALRNR